MKRVADQAAWVVLGASAAALVWLVPLTASADLPPFLRNENGHVQDGNELLKKGDAKGALAEYDHAARSLPDNAGVQLDRGLSLLKMGELAKAREALLSATSPAAGADVRADAYQNLALAFYRDADNLAQQKKHEEAQKLFREAVDAAKRSLRLRPASRDAAWNLELAARRVREEEAKQKADDDKKKQDEKKDEKKDQKDQKDQQDKKDGQDQQGKPDDKQDDQAKKDGQDQKKPEPKPDDKPKDKQAGADKKPAEPKPSDAQPKQGDEQAGQKPIPRDVEKALDALKDGEENFERVRARNRASAERREPEKDW